MELFYKPYQTDHLRPVKYEKLLDDKKTHGLRSLKDRSVTNQDSVDCLVCLGIQYEM